MNKLMSTTFYNKKTFSYDIGEFIDRPNRFIAFVKYKDRILRCHVPDPGRLKELLSPGVTVLLRFPKEHDKGKTEAAMIGILIRDSKIWVSTDSQLASRCIRETWKELPYFKDFEMMKPEYTYGESRLDFFLASPGEHKQCLVEIKSVGLKKEDNYGYFPDAPTKRGTKHVRELTMAIQEGYRALVIFYVPRKDILGVKPNKFLDKDFYEAVKDANKLGVEFKALRFQFSPQGVHFDCEIPFSID